jgi:hypothetical protein
LRNDVFAINDLLQDAWQDSLLVNLQIDPVQLAEPDKIGPDKNAKFTTFHFSLLAIPRMTLVLEANPKFIHLNEIG